MANGYMGKLLDVDLTKGEIKDFPLTDAMCRDYVGGYGFGVKVLYDRMKPKVDPMGPDNILGILTGPMTGTPCIEGNRFVAVCKSPLTGTWGDANCGGNLGPQMKFAGYDGVLFIGAASKPTYLLIENGEASLHDASDLWGKDSNETEDILIARHGRRCEVATIGVAGEKLSLIACIMTDKGRAAGRSGVGAVMGSKKLKAIVVQGRATIPMADPEGAKQLRRKYLRAAKEGLKDNILHTAGTIGITSGSALSGDSPIKNWGGAGTVDFEQGIEKFSVENVMPSQKKSYGCWRCSLACGGHVEVDEGQYKGTAHHKPEYETMGSFGMMTLNDNYPSLVKINELCNLYGLDTISAGCTVAFVIECFENGILTLEDTDGIPMNWGNHESIIAMTKKMAYREGFGDVLADGVQRASERIGRGSEQYAVHVHGQELPMHDPRFDPSLATTYVMDATPGRHTQGVGSQIPGDLGGDFGEKYVYTGKGEFQRKAMALMHGLNAAGVCQFAYGSYPTTFIPDFMTLITGKKWGVDEWLEVGERIGTLRHVFNLREGLNPLEWEVSPRMIGVPPLEAGNVRGVTVDIKTLIREYLEAVDWDTESTRPSNEKLEKLGLAFVAKDI